MSPGIVLGMAALAIIFIYTVSYGVWTWKSGNITGAAAVFLIALASALLPLYKIFFRE